MRTITITEKQLVETALVAYITADFNNQVNTWKEVERFDGIYDAIEDYGIWPDYLDIDKMHFNDAFGLASAMNMYCNRAESALEMFIMDNKIDFDFDYGIDLELVIEEDLKGFKELVKIVAEKTFDSWGGYSQEMNDEGKLNNGSKAYKFFKDLIDRELIGIILEERNKKYAA